MKRAREQEIAKTSSPISLESTESLPSVDEQDLATANIIYALTDENNFDIGTRLSLTLRALQNGANPNVIIDKDLNSWSATPLDKMIGYGCLIGVEQLIEHGADLYNNGINPVLVAVRNNQPKILDYLLNHTSIQLSIADEQQAIMDVLENSRNFIMRTDANKCLKLFLKHNINPNFGINIQLGESKYQNWTPLMEACEIGNYDTVILLLEHGADVNVQEDLHGYTPLDRAIDGEKLKCVEALLHAGANPNTCDSDNNTPIMTAAKNNTPTFLNILKLLLEYNANVRAINKGGESTLTLAALHGNIPALCWLIYRGADIHQKNNSHLTTQDICREIQDAFGEEDWDDASILLENESIATDEGIIDDMVNMSFDIDSDDINDMNALNESVTDSVMSLISKGEESQVYIDYFNTVIRPEELKKFTKKENFLNQLIKREIGK